MISNFQRNKLVHLFNMLDSHRNGYLQVEDFSEIAERIRQSFGYESGKEKHVFLAEKSTKFFHTLLSLANHTGDHSISLQEWISFIENDVIGSGNQDNLDEFTEFIVGFVFDMFDENHDGYISTDEYVDMFVIYGIDIKYSAKSFISLDINKDDRLSRQELIHAFEVFLTSDDHAEIGNWIFGRID